jgi:hypothetical protein
VSLQMIANLMRLRYKLLWAKTRTRNGKIALFFAGYLLLVMLLVILAAGGLGAGVIAVKTGKAARIASYILTGLFFQALIATVILGFGINEVFADTELRRYPLRAGERQVARHFLGIADPFWLLILVLELGLMAGLYLYGAGSFWLGLLAVLLLFFSNYVFARVLAVAIQRLVVKKGGSTLILAGVFALAFLPSLIGPALKKNPGAIEPWLRAIWYLPPGGAAVAMTQPNLSALSGLETLCFWIAGLMFILIVLEQRPPRVRSAVQGKVKWDSPFERIGGIFGAENAVMVGQWLRFYSRNNRFRTIYPLAVPLIGFLVVIYSRQGAFGSDAAGKHFVGALGAFLCVGFIGTAQFAVNQFGYVGSGFRRYMLLPTDPATTLRAGSYAFLLLSSVLIPIAALAWLIFAPVKTDYRMLIMLVCCSIIGLFVMNGIGIWVAILAPRRGNYYARFGNDLSLVANIVVIGGMFLLLFLPRLLSKLAPGAVSPDNFWAYPILAVAAVLFYRYSLAGAEGAFRVRRERLLAMTEGRS